MYTIGHDYYAILGVSKNATTEEIRQQYKKLIKKHHPDRFKGLRVKYQEKGDADLLEVLDEKIRRADEMCQLINEAFEVLSDPAKRKQYDAEVVEPSVPLPEIVVNPSKIIFGTLNGGLEKSSEFTIENKGGPAAAVNIDWEGNKPDWGELVIEPDPETTFPIKVTIKVDTTGISSGPKDEKILINVDGRIHMVEVFLAVTKPVPTAAPTMAIPVPSIPRKTNLTISGVIALIVITIIMLIIGSYLGIQIVRIGGNNQAQSGWATETAQSMTTQRQATQTAIAIQQARQTILDEFRNTIFVENVELVGGEFPLKFRFVNNWNKTVYVRTNSFLVWNCAIEFRGQLDSSFLDGRDLAPGEKTGFVYCKYQGDPELFCQPTVSFYEQPYNLSEPWNICPYKYK